jgi:hypothetical protein
MNNRVIVSGTAKWAKVRQPDVYQGVEVGYTMNLYPDNIKEYEKAVKSALEEVKTDARFARKQFKNPRNGVREDEDGVKYIYLKAKSNFTDPDTGEVTRRYLNIYDKTGAIIPQEVLIGNGSEVEVAVDLVPYHFGANTCGITPRIAAIKVNKLVEYNGGSGTGYGFTFDESGDSVTFTDSTEEAEELDEGVDF